MYILFNLSSNFYIGDLPVSHFLNGVYFSRIIPGYSYSGRPDREELYTFETQEEANQKILILKNVYDYDSYLIIVDKEQAIKDYVCVS